MKKSSLVFSLLALSSMVLPSCSQSIAGTIYFELEGGEFLDESFSTSYLTGEAGKPVLIDIPDPVKEGYYFVGWREKKTDGSYRVINKRLSDNGNSYYYFPFGSDTFYAYFEPLVTIDFDLTLGAEGGNLIAPLYQSENFSDHTLNGYASKSIPSLDYLPTADATKQHLNFEYWYLKYPLKTSKDENHNKHFFLDTSAPEGIYQFDKAFKVDDDDDGSMEFLLDSHITLYAKWEADPSITVHFNMEGFDDYTFQAKGNASAELTSLMKEKFNIDYSVSANNYYYIHEGQDKKYRFQGFYLNDTFSEIFALDSSIGQVSFDLYLRWDKEISITFDYNGGELNGETSHRITSGYFGGDILGTDIASQYVPNKQYATFLSYQLNGETFSFDRDALPDEDVVFLATYDDYPTLNLRYDYPDGLDASLKKEDKEYRFALGEDISSALASFKGAITEESLQVGNFYTLDSSSDKSDFTLTSMPDSDCTVYLKVNYTPHVQIETYANLSSTYDLISQSDLADNYSSSYSFYFENNFSQADLTNTTDLIKDSSNNTYLFDGFYFDTALTNKVIFPLALHSSHTSIPELMLYRKMTKAIILTFKEESTSEIIGVLNVIPGSKTSDYIAEITSLCGSFTSLILDDGLSSILGNTLPDSDCSILVRR